MIEKQNAKVEPKFRFADDFLDLKTLNTNVIIAQLEENIKLREMSIEHQLKKKFMRV